MKNLGSYPVYLIGSRRTVKRVVLDNNGKYFIKWYGQLIEVVRGFSGYFRSVEEY